MAYQYELPRELNQRLLGLGKRVRRVAVLAGCGKFLLCVTALFVAVMSADWLIDFEPRTRLGMLIGFGLATLALAGWCIVRPCLRKLSSTELAAFAEQQFPELGERLTSLVELAQPGLPDGQRGSAFMREMLERETIECLADCEIEQAVPKHRALRSFWSGTAALVGLLLSFVLFPSVSGMLFARLLNPFGNFESVGRLQFEVVDGDRVVARGSDVTIAARIQWRSGSDDPIPEPVSISVRSANGEADSRDLQFNSESNAFQATLPSVFDSFDFQVVGDGGRSKKFHVEVVDAPSVTAAKLIVETPPYVGEPRREIDGVTGEIRVFERSRLQWQLSFNKPMKSAEIEWLSASVVPGTQFEKKKDGAAAAKDEKRTGPRINELAPAIDELPRTAMKLAADGRTATLELPAELQAIVAFRLRDEHGLTNEEPHRQLLITLDQPPLLEMTGSTHDEARPTDVYALKLAAADDLGLGALELHLKAESGLNQVIKVPNEKLGGTSLEHEFRIDLKDLALKVGDRLSLQVRAADERPVPGANEVWSEVRYVTLRADALSPGASDVIARQKELKQELEAIRQDLNVEKKRSDELQAIAQQNETDKKPFKQADKLVGLAEQEHATAERLKDLAERFAEHPLFANLAADAKKIAEQEIAKQSQQLQTATKFEPKDLAEQLADNAVGLKKADEQLAAMEKRLDQLAKLERELLDVGRLAQRANQLADDATQLEAKRKELEQSPLLAGERPEDRAEAREQLQQEQAQLGKEQGELLAALDKLLEEKKEIVESARDHQLDRLAQLAEQAKKLADRQDQLAEAVDGDAKHQQAAAAPLAEKQAALAEKTQQLADQVEAQQARTPVTPIDPEAAQKILDEIKAGNAQAAEALAQKLAQDAERTQQELLKGEPLPADPREAAKALADRQRALAKDIAQAADQLAKGEEPQSLRDLAAKETAIETAAAQLDAGKDARDEQKAAVDQAAEAVKQLIEAAKAEEAAGQKPAKPMDGKNELAAPSTSEKAQAAAQRAAEGAKQAAAALDQLAEAAQTAEQQQAAAADREAQQKQTQAALAQLQKQQDELKKQAAEQLGDGKQAPNTEQLKQLAEQEQKLADQVGELATPQAQSAKRAAEQALDAAADALAQPPSEQQAQAANRALQQAEQALERLAQAANRAAPNDPQAEARELAEQARELAQQERQLAQELAELNQPKGDQPAAAQPMPPQANAGQPMNNEQPNGAPMKAAAASDDPQQSNARAAQSEPGNDRASPRELAEQQANLAAEAAELARQATEQAGAESPAAQAARQAANRGEQAQGQAQNGQLDQAAQNAEQAAQSARQASEALKESAPGMSQRASDLAERQQQVADRLEQLAGDPAARAEAQRNQQRRLANQTSNLQRELNQLAEQLGAAPLDLGQQSQQANQAGQAAGEGQQAQRDAQQALQQGNAGDAAQASQEAAEALRQAAQQAQNAQPASGQQHAIPGELASQLTTAAQRLQQAQRELAASQPGGDQPAGAAPMSSLMNGQPMSGQPMSGQPMAGQPMPGQSGQAQSGQPNSAEQARAANAEALRQAAEQLSQAAERLQADVGKPQSGNRPRSISANQQQAANNSNPSSSSGEQGNQGPGDLSTPEGDLLKQAQRNWGKLPGTLKTEILQSSQRKANGDYSKLIKLYFEELAKSGSGESAKKPTE